MKHTACLLAFVLTGTACLGPAPARAQPTAVDRVGAYLGGSLGWMRAEDLNDDAINRAAQGQGLAVRTTSVDPDGGGWKLFAGRSLDRWIAVEGGYTRFGRYAFHGQVIADPGSVDATFKADDWNLAAVGLWPLGDRLELSAKAGIGWWQARLDAIGTLSASGAHQSRAHGTSPLVGLGGVLQLAPAWGLRLEWERFLNIGNVGGTGRTDIDFCSLGVQRRF